MTATTLTTELEAVNTMLRGIGESPVNTLSGSPTIDVANAKSTLDEISREFQMKGWEFNTDEEYTLTPDTYTKEIALPANCGKVDTVGKDECTKATQRGLKLYDPVNHTYEWDNSLVCDITLILPFEELPQHARHYLMIKATRKFASSQVGDQVLNIFTEKDEMDAKSAFMNVESENADYNILNDPHIQRTLKR